MIRDSRSFHKLVIVAAVLLYGAMADYSIARAGDADGVQGYSMRLKNKDFTIDPGATGASGTLASPLERETSGSCDLKTTRFAQTVHILSTGIRTQWSFLWLMLRLR